MVLNCLAHIPQIQLVKNIPFRFFKDSESLVKNRNCLTLKKKKKRKKMEGFSLAQW